MSLKIAVCVKSVPDKDHYDKLTIDSATKSLVRSAEHAVINGADRHALELAFALRDTLGAEVTAVTMGMLDAREQLFEALAMGADKAVLLSDARLAGSDTSATSYALSVLLRQLGGFDVVVAGNESEDGATAHVPSQLGEWLGVAHISNVTDVDMAACSAEHLIVGKELDCGGTTFYRIDTPCVVSVNKKLNTVRRTTVWGLYEARHKPSDVLSCDDMAGLDGNCVGHQGSPTQPGELYPTGKGARRAQAVTGTPDEIAIAILDKIGVHTMSQARKQA
ncbi:MAG: electron transfer flavoprotein subunit beta/FixA family protein [Defluviitaleaceae bacterium]|nr:electron transfer flavoprotein subunit beta/FixA family protein [Defluviitaleaceae bacterium]